MSDDPIICCVLGLCCPPGSPEQEEALATYLANDAESTPDAMRPAAKAVLRTFDLLPHGSLAEFQRIARRAAKKK